jgi:hypothetical protein
MFRIVDRNWFSAKIRNWTKASPTTMPMGEIVTSPKIGIVRATATDAASPAWIAARTLSMRSFATYAVMAGVMPPMTVAAASASVNGGLDAQTRPMTRGTAASVPVTARRKAARRPPSSGSCSGSGRSGSPVNPEWRPWPRSPPFPRPPPLRGGPRCW